MTMASSGSGAGESGGGRSGGSRAPPPATEGPQQPSVTAPAAAATVATAATATSTSSVSSVADLPRANESYEEISIIGNGAYGTVYLARDRNNMERAVALKKIRITLNEDGVPVNAVREISLLKQLERFEHPNIVRLLDICQGRIEGGQRLDREQRLNLVLVFEYVDQDLDRYLKRCPSPGLEPARIKNLMHQILCGVDFLHSNRVIHRDLKPQNILVDRNGRVKIADFGLARIYDFNMRLTTQVVTLWYRAPEILLSNSYATPSDLWSCGCIFAELFRRVPIFKGNTEGDQLQRIFDVIGTPHESDWPSDVSLSRSNFRHRPGKQVRDIVPEITDDAADLLQKMLKFVPRIRICAIDALRHPYFRGLITPHVMATSNRSTPTQQVLSPAPLATSSPANTPHHLHQRLVTTTTANTVNVTAANTSEQATLPSQVTANDENNPNAGNSANTKFPVVSMMPEAKVAERAITVADTTAATDTSVTNTSVTPTSAGIHPPPGNSSNAV